MNAIQERDTTTIRQTVTFSAPPLEVYEMIMDSGKHASLSGETAVISREVGGAFTAWGDHISGFNLALRPWGHRSRPISPRPLASRDADPLPCTVSSASAQIQQR